MADGLSLDLNALSAKAAEIAEVDEKLDSATDSASAGKRAIMNRLVEANTSTVDSMIESIEKFLADKDADVVAGVYTGVVRNLKSKYDEVANSYAQSLADADPGVASDVVMTPEQLTELEAQRKTLKGQFDALKNVLESFGIDVSSVPAPKKRTGARGKRAARAITLYNYAINGETLPASESTLTAIAKRCGDAFENVPGEDGKTLSPRKAFSNFLESIEFEDGEKFDIKNPPAEWSVELPNGETLSAVRFEAEPEDEEDAEDGEETE